MRWLVTSDWQVEWANLDTAETAWKEVLSICRKRKLEGIVVSGDLKQAYNPVDVRVTKWWLKAIQRAKKRGLRVIIVNGNHDRVGQYTDAQNWLPILARAGAETFDKPVVVVVEDGAFAILPFCSSVKQQRQWASELAEHPTIKLGIKEKNVLLFHSDISKCKYNILGMYASLSVPALKAEHRYPGWR